VTTWDSYAHIHDVHDLDAHEDAAERARMRRTGDDLRTLCRSCNSRRGARV
jgi:hypothetical protein